MINLGEWPFVLAVAGFVVGIIAAAVSYGELRSRVRTLEQARSAQDAKMELMQAQLSKGDSSFVELRTLFGGVTQMLAEMKVDIEQLLSRRTG